MHNHITGPFLQPKNQSMDIYQYMLERQFFPQNYNELESRYHLFLNNMVLHHISV
jgi:hypothetical protein